MLYILLLIGVSSPALTQENWQIALSSGDTLAHVGLLQVREDSLEVASGGTSRWIAIASVNEVRAVRTVDVWGTARDGAWYTGLVAAVASAVVIAASAHSSPVFSFDPGNTAVKILGAVVGAVLFGSAFGLIGGTVAGVVALVQDQDTVYDLSHTSLKGKQYILHTILKEP